MSAMTNEAMSTAGMPIFSALFIVSGSPEIPYIDCGRTDR
jgi:hypothetical protein